MRRLVDRDVENRRARRRPVHDHHKSRIEQTLRIMMLMQSTKTQGYQTRSLFFSDRQTIEPAT